MSLDLLVVNGLDVGATIRYAHSLVAPRPSRAVIRYDLSAASVGLVSQHRDDGLGNRDVTVAGIGECFSCGVSEHLAGTILRLAQSADTDGVVAVLPPGVESRLVREHLTRRGGFEPDTTPGTTSDPTSAPVRSCAVVSLVDPFGLLAALRSPDRFAHAGWLSADCDVRTNGELLARQVEDSDIVVAYDPRTRRAPGAATGSCVPAESGAWQLGIDLISAINPLARIDVPGNPAALDTEVGLAPGGLHAGAGPAEALPDGPANAPWTVSWFRRVPFNPDRLAQAAARVLDMSVRGRGTAWLSDRPDHAHHWDSTGSRVTLQLGSRWNASATGASATEVPRPRTAPHQALRLVGLSGTPDDVVAILDDCLEA